MNTRRPIPNRTATTLRRLSVVSACLLIGVCASVPARTASAATESRGGAQQDNSEQRNRQFQKAEALYLSGHLKDAAAKFQELTKTYPSDAHIWLKYGNALTRLGSYDDAATAYETAAALDASLGGAALNLALVRIAQTREALDVAIARLAPGSEERAEADSLRKQIETIAGAPQSGTPAH